MSTSRRSPQQERGERRVAQLLEAAGAEMAEVGYEATTMTAIAERAGASIGTLYQYFPDKDAVAVALRAQYVAEFEECWAALEGRGAKLNLRRLADLIVDTIVDYIARRPAYLPLMTTLRNHKRDHGARNRLREHIAALFRGRRPELTKEDALRMANVTVQTLKGMNPLFVDATEPEKEAIVREFKMLLFGYLSVRLKAH